MANSPSFKLKMSSTDIFWTFKTAQVYGGSFYRLLGEAGLHADEFNQKTLLKSFPLFALTYGPASRLHQESRNAEQ